MTPRRGFTSGRMSGIGAAAATPGGMVKALIGASDREGAAAAASTAGVNRWHQYRILGSNRV
jgi:hypothetical protein